jgi:predicted nucleic acid-binding protein
LDTNVVIFALRGTGNQQACRTLLFERLPELKVYLPLQVMLELDRNLTRREMQLLWRVFRGMPDLVVDYQRAASERIRYWQQQGAKKGDAVIVAQLEARDIRLLISENRHFLAEVAGLPFDVLSSSAVLTLLDQ